MIHIVNQSIFSIFSYLLKVLFSFFFFLLLRAMGGDVVEKYETNTSDNLLEHFFCKEQSDRNTDFHVFKFRLCFHQIIRVHDFPDL